ncbi:MAG TPA: hypothetical protein VFQ38_22850 [Longimicrobiales bacterium]|nr:hypothetical protein [Longimicrobiales bacterium]
MTTTKQGPFGRARLLALAILVVTFVAGALAGAAVTRVVNAEGSRRGGPPIPPRTSVFAPGSPLAERLNVTDAQRAQIEAIVARERPRADSVARQLRERLRATFDSTNAQIRTVLTPEQRVEFDRFLAERRARMHERFGGRPDGERHGRRGDDRH